MEDSVSNNGEEEVKKSNSTTARKWTSKSEKILNIANVKEQLKEFNTDTIATVFNYINANIVEFDIATIFYLFCFTNWNTWNKW